MFLIIWYVYKISTLWDKNRPSHKLEKREIRCYIVTGESVAHQAFLLHSFL